jgi:hypothetical protein
VATSNENNQDKVHEIKKTSLVVTQGNKPAIVRDQNHGENNLGGNKLCSPFEVEPSAYPDYQLLPPV